MEAASAGGRRSESDDKSVQSVSKEAPTVSASDPELHFNPSIQFIKSLSQTEKAEFELARRYVQHSPHQIYDGAL